MKKIIKNRDNQNISIIIEETADQKGLAFIMHGLGGFKEQPHLQAIAQAFKDAGFTTIIFDTTNTLGKGESGGNYEDATVTNYYADLEDVINWAEKQSWYQEPFCLMGHSLGGICTALYAENHPNKVKGLAPISTVISGKLSATTEKHVNIAEEWEKTGWRITESISQPGITKKLKWSHMTDRLKYDLLLQVQKLTMPMLLIVGDQDNSTPIKHHEILYDELPAKKEMHIIKNGPHTFKDLEHLKEIKNIFDNWIAKEIL